MQTPGGTSLSVERPAPQGEQDIEPEAPGAVPFGAAQTSHSVVCIPAVVAGLYDPSAQGSQWEPVLCVPGGQPKRESHVGNGSCSEVSAASVGRMQRWTGTQVPF
mmetsp:Transcript_47411/g.112745  ORF Transcript_47411/g.112745 Transcript_47411/m.112745 type:complete len:105 (+) Transcript_47411:433-747(+)